MLPVEKHKADIQQSLRVKPTLVFTAPPGSGKSTMLPLFLSEMPELKGEVVVLQPRRLAARMLASSVASMNGFTIGKEIGYQVRGDKKRGPETKVSYRTDGLFLRQLINEDIDNVSAVILDEFHERSWQMDVILPLLIERQKSKKDFYLVVMSATMETENLCHYLDCPLLICESQLYPVEIYYNQFSRNVPLWERAFRSLSKHLDSASASGNILIFMPGVFEINKTISLCRNLKGIEVCALYGSMRPEEQDRSLSDTGQRKVIVCTNIAETSLTVQGVNTVIDAGYSRVNRYEPGRGIDTLNLEVISVFSAEQRSGRAGRLGPGISYRLWSDEEHSRRILAAEPEVLRIDISEVLLQIIRAGHAIPNFNWYEKPAEKLLADGLEQLRVLGAVKSGKLTEDGLLMADFPLHPRIAKFLIEAHKNSCYMEACYWAAILSEQSPIDHKAKLDDKDSPSSDLAAITTIWNNFFSSNSDKQKALASKYKIKRGVLKTLGTSVQQFSRLLPASGDNFNDLKINLLKSLLSAYSDRLAVRVDRGTLRYRLANGRVAELTRTSSVRDAEFIVALESIELNNSGSTKLIISMGAEVPYELIEEVFLEELQFDEEVEWSETSRSAEYFESVSLYGLRLRSQKIVNQQVKTSQSEFLASKVLDGSLKISSWNSEVSKWIQRVSWVREVYPEKDLPEYSDEDIKKIVVQVCFGSKSYKEIKNVNVIDYFKNLLSWDDQQFVLSMTPSKIELPNGKNLKIKYEQGKAPKVTGYIQDFYGLTETPKVAGGRIKVLLEMLAPNRKPVHLTDDLEGFWDGVYKDIKSQLAGRYPKHKWI
ncbi:MAG: ATP-dependent helicase HrpB [Lentisphaeraceae bacterium]|nr:ATP-dependent helicase HrpB [Lentisphaeraceae bacterium]